MAVQEAALHGSSHYVMPGLLRWMTGNIGIHHVHHLSSRVPCYRLPEVLKDYPELADIGRITILESLRCVKLVLWTKIAQAHSFREARTWRQCLSNRCRVEAGRLDGWNPD